jgi:hypothetical protein
MYHPDCKAYQRHDHTASTKQIRLSQKYWSLIEAKQKEIAEERGVKNVSRPVALKQILDEAYCKPFYHPAQLIETNPTEET